MIRPFCHHWLHLLTHLPYDRSASGEPGTPNWNNPESSFLWSPDPGWSTSTTNRDVSSDDFPPVVYFTVISWQSLFTGSPGKITQRGFSKINESLSSSSRDWAFSVQRWDDSCLTDGGPTVVLAHRSGSRCPCLWGTFTPLKKVTASFWHGILDEIPAEPSNPGPSGQLRAATGQVYIKGVCSQTFTGSTFPKWSHVFREQNLFHCHVKFHVLPLLKVRTTLSSFYWFD